jgi:hypothetical protein
MPLRLASQAHASRGQRIAATLAIGGAALFAALYFMTGTPLREDGAVSKISTPRPAALSPSRGHWTIVFERDEACTGTCSHVLDTLNAVSRDPASGVPDGDAQIVVRTTPQPAKDLIVLDAEGQPAGFISHTDDPGRIISGLATLRASQSPGTPVASR